MIKPGLILLELIVNKLLKLSYLTNLGKNVNDPITSQKSYWTIINIAMNKCNVEPPTTFYSCKQFVYSKLQNGSLLLIVVYHPS